MGSTGSQKIVELTLGLSIQEKLLKKCSSIPFRETGRSQLLGLDVKSSSMSLAESIKSFSIQKTLDNNGFSWPTMYLILSGV